MRIQMKDQFQKTSLVADDLASGDLAVLGFAYFIGNTLCCQIFLVAPNRRNFRDRINTIRKKLRRALGWNSKRVTRREPSLLHGGRSERWKADHIADRVDVGDICLVMFAHLQEATLVRLEADCFDVKRARRACPPDAIKRHLGNDLLPATQMNLDAVSVVVGDGFNHLSSGKQIIT